MSQDNSKGDDEGDKMKQILHFTLFEVDKETIPNYSLCINVLFITKVQVIHKQSNTLSQCLFQDFTFGRELRI